MKKKLAISVICGGRSAEHEISIQSARNVVIALNLDRYEVSVIFIDRNGKWYLIDNTASFLTQMPQHLIYTQKITPITVALGMHMQPWQSLNEERNLYRVDCVFPMIHGTQGEDGVLQGLLELLRLPYVGADVQSSAICIKKDIAKSLLRAAGIAVADWYTIWSFNRLEGIYKNLVYQWKTTELFMKAVSLGSSVATAFIRNAKEFQKGAENIFYYDNRLIVEPRIYGREIACAVLGNNKNPKAALLSEAIPTRNSFYSYEEKYINHDKKITATTKIVDDLSQEKIRKIQRVAIDAFKVVHCFGMARVDFFLTSKEQIIVNEINTIPGFTSVSMYPKMWEATGLSYSALLDRLIELAIERYQDQKKLIYHYNFKSNNKIRN
ncbi:D-alanine--D-alanine ligase family protein [Coxiella endosymbiont of Amblyomma americanum]|uniref:D-alanine--D-alanine ligase family protein n=1 Tax=Coxiella endosymbiont of Amblyomma americanum TaxID=325775 RepID=UPI00057E06E7|nr:D-alanine--D-alanine ligase family protein [Coxiella endosymbiont of Amblyomma americanum]AJC50537.1 D-alanine--D-alanine ligase [Coxiella endosymbiont of Amblyomma americanum]AUJ58871.1 D-alanine--D-alanine ligase [Coxiella-like endosymbiont of Amblyomma americanum]